VVDSRPTSDGTRRRRICNECKRRFTTYERLGPTDIRVTKRGDRPAEPFSHDKLVRVLLRLCANRPVSKEAIERLARHIEAELLDDRRHIIHSSELVELLLGRLKDLDRLAHSRLLTDYLDENGRLRTEPRTDDETLAQSQQLDMFAEADEDADTDAEAAD
jgi:transcriptional repressor NrdR